jgi:hypothetical protein
MKWLKPFCQASHLPVVGNLLQPRQLMQQELEGKLLQLLLTSSYGLLERCVHTIHGTQNIIHDHDAQRVLHNSREIEAIFPQ